MSENEKKFERFAQLFKALDHPVRIKILYFLNNNRCNVTNLENILGISQSRVSQHLRVLRLSGIISPKRMGKEICYDIIDEDVKKILSLCFKENG